MAELQSILAERFIDAVVTAFGEDHKNIDPLIQVAGNPKFGDYQANLAMSLAKKVGQNPRQVAVTLLENLKLDDISDEPTIAGPGFINIKLKRDFLEAQLEAMYQDKNLGVTQAATPQRVVIDYSSPNVAKEMHVGHLRSTIIGDSLVRVLRSQGHDAIGQNHLGDWGTQFGMLIEHMIDTGTGSDANHAISDLNTLYQASKKHFDDDAEFANRARTRVVKLQSGDEETLAKWRQLVNVSMEHFNEAYATLGILLKDDDVKAESFYNDKLQGVIDQLADLGMLKESQGAKCVFPKGYNDKEGDPLPMIVQKSGGGFIYATTDLAAAQYRVNEIKADRIAIVTDARQGQHFAMVFQTVKEAKWDNGVKFEHVPFGAILGEDNKPFKTRSGGTVKLSGLIEDAIASARKVIEEKSPELDDSIKAEVAKAVGIGALKYADLSSDRIKDYVFSMERMLSLKGNTAPYLINSYVRTASMFRKAGLQPADVASVTMALAEDATRDLALKLLQYPAAVESVAISLEPHRMCNYVYELASLYHSFYAACPVLKPGYESTRDTRLKLCHLTAKTIQRALGLLGIDTVEQM